MTLCRTFATMFILLVLTPASHQQSIRILNLKQNPVLLTIETGSRFVKLGNHKLFHIIELNNDEPIFTKLLTNIQGIRTFSNSTDIFEILQAKFETVHHIFSSLKPNRRQKRGLFNIIGTSIKGITGNMDHNDFDQISKTLTDLQNSNRMLINENNEQFKINLQLHNRINFIINRMNQQNTQITKNIISARFENEVSTNFKAFSEILKINYNLDNLKNHLEDLFEAIQSAKSNVIPKQILSIEELGFVTGAAKH